MKIILYNFFEDSIASANQWRLVLNEVSDGGSPQGVPAFDETRHASLCVEVGLSRPGISFPSSFIPPKWQLKSLYVAITRARKKLWIVDNSASAEPMKVLQSVPISVLSNHTHRNTGVAWRKSLSGRLPQKYRYLSWRSSLLPKNGQWPQ